MIATRESGILLPDAITRDGLDLKFVILMGPDHVRRNWTPPWKAWDCEEIVVSDLAKSAGFTTLEGALLQLKDCESWKRVRGSTYCSLMLP